MTLEQQFTHRSFLDGLNKLNSEEKKEILEIVYANYLIRGRILENIIKYCITHNVDLPSFGDLIDL
jgi:hypothetical protein